MAIEFFVGDVKQVGSQLAVFVNLRNTDGLTAYRRAEVKAPVGTANLASWVSQVYSPQALWDMGAEINAASFIAARERVLEDYYYNIAQAVNSVPVIGGTIDVAIGQGLTAIAMYAPKQAEFQAWQAMTGLTNPTTNDQKILLLFGMLHFVTVGLLAGGIRNRGK